MNEFKQIRDDVVAIDGELAKLRRENNYFPVIGEGSHEAKIMFIGEAPGETEAKTGRPFVGRAGKFLEELLQSISVKREDVYITNIVKDRPPKNRDPLPEEIELYAPFLDRQIAAMRPKVIATLGRFSMQYIMQRYGLSFELGSISQIHGKVFETEVEGEKVLVVPLFHPAVALYDGSKREDLKHDFAILKSLI
jgi:uracil-DNA glycosylase